MYPWWSAEHGRRLRSSGGCERQVTAWHSAEYVRSRGEKAAQPRTTSCGGGNGSTGIVADLPGCDSVVFRYLIVERSLNQNREMSNGARLSRNDIRRSGGDIRCAASVNGRPRVSQRNEQLVPRAKHTGGRFCRAPAAEPPQPRPYPDY